VIFKGSCSDHVSWHDLCANDLDQLIQARASQVVEEIMLELLPEILDIHGGAKSRNVSCGRACPK
jgi:hypothetical protein